LRLVGFVAKVFDRLVDEGCPVGTAQRFTVDAVYAWGMRASVLEDGVARTLQPIDIRGESIQILEPYPRNNRGWG
jgi:hypothetical protein